MSFFWGAWVVLPILVLLNPIKITITINTSTFSKEKQRRLEHDYYIGATVLQPKKGLYHNLAVVDVSSLYPTIVIRYNISFDTVNCECCKNKPEAMVDKEITKDCTIEKEYWICQLNKEGAFPKKLRIFREESLFLES